MDIHPLFLLEFLFFNVVVLAWAGYELWSVRKKDEPSSRETGHAERQHGADEG